MRFTLSLPHAHVRVGRVTAYNPGTALRQRADILAEPQWQLTFTQHDGHGCNTCIWVSSDQLHAGLLPPDADIRPARGTRAIIPGKPKKSKARKATYTVNYSFPDKVVPWHDAAVNFWRQTLGHGSDADKTIALRLSHFKPNTVKSYSTGWNRFTDFCARSGQAPLPQTREMVMTWISVDLALTINANNMQSYLTAVNDAHMDTKAGPAPALGIDVRATINGLKNRQVSLKKTKDVRVFRAHEVSRLLDHALDQPINYTSRTACEQLRSTTAVVVDYVHFNRGDTGVRLRPGDLTHHRGDLMMRKRKLKAGTGVAAGRINLVPMGAVPDSQNSTEM